jgi:hypothetical protein
MRPTISLPSEVRVWRVAGIIHASIPRTVVRTPVVIEHGRDSAARPPGDRDLFDLALNILNVFAEPRRGAAGDLEPIKCFRGYCSSFAARHHVGFARDFLKPLPAEGGAIATARITAWMDDQRRATAGETAAAADAYLDALSA